MIEITKMEPINKITSTLVWPLLSNLRYSISFIIFYRLKVTICSCNLINAYIVSNGTYILCGIQSTCIIAEVRPVNQQSC